jgi:hypothetical protein
MPTDTFTRIRISPVSFPCGREGVKLQPSCLVSFPAPPPAPRGLPGLVGIPPAVCQSPSVNKALIGCCPVRTGPPEKSNYWLRGFKAAQGRLMKGDKLGTVSRIPAGRPRQPRSRGAAESPRIKGIRREGEAGGQPRRPRPPRAALTWGGDRGSRAGTPRFLACRGRGPPPAPRFGRRDREELQVSPRLCGPGRGAERGMRACPVGTAYRFGDTGTGNRDPCCQLPACALGSAAAAGRWGARDEGEAGCVNPVKRPEIRLARSYSLGRRRLN